jgi:REP element-mobilizing transposase RayT
MSVKKRHHEVDTFYFITFTCFKWQELFEITSLYDNIYSWFDKLEKEGVYNCGYVIMPNHIHLLVYLSRIKKTIDKIIGNGKRFMAYEIVARLNQLGREDLVELMRKSVKASSIVRNKKHEVFEPSFDCKEVITEKFIRQKLNYMHKNPVSGKWKLVEDYLDYQYSSARFYDLGDAPDCKLFHYTDMRSAESPLKNLNQIDSK